ncbi:MAG: succinate dehydrogenase / fumarate reductase cytochrome b subunit [Myxococcota bacterium]
MSWLTQTLTSSTGRKALVAITGLGLVGFLLIHMLGNLQIMLPGDQFNEYAKSLHDGPLIVIGDIGLLIMFPIHIGLVIWLAVSNRRARGGTGYKKHGNKQKRGVLAVLASRTSLWSGLGLMAFVVAHILHFRLRHDEIGYDLKADVVTELSEPYWAIIYIVGSLLASWHIYHGFQAAFRSLGFEHNRYTPILVKTGTGISALLAIGFVAITTWILFAQPAA